MKIDNRAVGFSSRMPTDNFKLPELRYRQLYNPEAGLEANGRMQAVLHQFSPVNLDQVHADMDEILMRSVDAVNRYLQDTLRYQGIRFSVDTASGRTVAVVRDMDTGQVLRQIPSESMLVLAARVRELSGVLVDVTG